MRSINFYYPCFIVYNERKTHIVHWKEQRHNSKFHSCIFKTDPRGGAKVIMTQYKHALRQI